MKPQVVFLYQHELFRRLSYIRSLLKITLLRSMERVWFAHLRTADRSNCIVHVWFFFDTPLQQKCHATIHYISLLTSGCSWQEVIIVKLVWRAGELRLFRPATKRWPKKLFYTSQGQFMKGLEDEVLLYTDVNMTCTQLHGNYMAITWQLHGYTHAITWLSRP